jgi:hypothetical protein
MNATTEFVAFVTSVADTSLLEGPTAHGSPKDCIDPSYVASAKDFQN